MDRTERFYKIDQLLKGGRGLSFDRLTEVLGVSRATLKRDFGYMRDRFNAPIEYDRDTNAYRFGKPRAGPRYELPGLWFSASEVYALLSTLRLLGDLQPGLLADQVAGLVSRLREVAGGEDHDWKEIEKRIRIFQPERRQGDPTLFPIVAAALLKRRRLQIRHYNRGEDRTTEREVSPQRLVHYGTTGISMPIVTCGRGCAVLRSTPSRRQRSGTRRHEKFPAANSMSISRAVTGSSPERSLNGRR